MTPPVDAKGSAAGKVDVSASKPEGPAAPPAAQTEEAKTKDPLMDRWQFMQWVDVDAGAACNGHPDGGLFGKCFGKLDENGIFRASYNFGTNYTTGELLGTLYGKAQLGIMAGMPETNGSWILDASIGPGTGLDWGHFTQVGPVQFLPSLDVGYLFGLGHGEYTAETIRQFQVTAPRHELWARLGLLKVATSDSTNLNFGLTAFTSVVDGDFNVPANGLLGSMRIAFGPKPTPKRTPPPPPPNCTEEQAKYHDLYAKAQDLKAQNTDLGDKVGAVRFFLENREQDPMNQATIRKAMVLGHMVESLKSQTDINKLDEAKKSASKAETKEAAIALFAGLEGVSAEQAQAAWTAGEDKYPANFDIWTLPEDAGDYEDNGANKYEKEPCTDKSKREMRDEIDQLHLDLEKLNKRNGTLEQQYKQVVHLAGLTLGSEKLTEIFKATFLRVDTPNFITARPQDKHTTSLKAWAEANKGKANPDMAALEKIIGKGRRGIVFRLPDFEAKKIRQLADWMNGKGELPGEEWVKKVLTEEKAKKGKKADPKDDARATKAAEEAEKEWVKNLKIKIAGHTDSRGNDAMNQALSQRRADAIKLMLIGFGVDESRLEATGYGEQYPLVPESGAYKQVQEARVKNRRVVFVPIGVDKPQAAHRDTYGELHDQTGSKKVGDGDPDKAKAKPKPKGKGDKDDKKKGKRTDLLDD